MGASQSDDANSQGVVAALEVVDGRESPATVRFTLIDQESDMVALEFLYQLPGEEARPMTLAGPGASAQTFSSSSEGVQHALTWNFAAEADLDSTGLNPEVRVFVREPGTDPGLIEGANSATIDLGNDPPQVTSLEVPAAEPTGIVLVEIGVMDSSSELIDLLIEFDVQGDLPDAGWRPARPAGLSSTPSPTLQDVLALASGSEVQFFWETGVDLASANSPVLLRATPSDGSESGSTMVSPSVDVSNNTPPLVLLDELTLDASSDRQGGVPIPFRVFDPEQDVVTTIVQWSQVSGSFPPLPSSGAELMAAIADPVQRRALQVAKEFERELDGTLVAIDSTRVRLVDLEEDFSQLVGVGFEGLSLQLMAPGGLRDLAEGWPAGTVASPVAAELLAEGAEVLVLEATSGDAWRLQRIVTRTGEASVLATGPGAPVALALDRDRALVASQSGADWQLATVDVEVGGVVVSGFGAGVLHDIDIRNGRLAVATVDQDLVQIGLTDAGAEVMPILSGFADPRGVALDPFSGNFAYVAESALDRVVRVDLELHLVSQVNAAHSGGGVSFPAPRHLAVAGTRRELLVVCEPSAGVGELRMMPLAAGPVVSAPEVLSETLELVAPGSRIATGADGLLLVTDPELEQVRGSGGVEQEFTIVEREGLTNIVRLDADFTSLPGSARRCRITVPPGMTRGQEVLPGAPGVFQWDTAESLTGGEYFLRITGFDGFSLGASDTGNFPVDLAGSPAMRDTDLELAGAPSVADLDGDGDYDLIVGESGATRVSIQGPPGVFTLDPTPIAFAGTSGPDGALAVVAADLDGDGRAELVAPAPDGLQIAYQQGDGSFQAPLTVLAPDVASPGTEVLATDLDGDGQAELLSVHSVYFGSSSIFLYRNQGGRSWIAESLGTTFSMNSAHLRDADADGDLDIVVNDAGYLEQTAPMTFELTVDPLLLLGPLEVFPGYQGESWYSFLPADLGEDGQLDLLANRQVVLVIFDDPPPSSTRLGRFVADGGGSFAESGPYIPVAQSLGTALAKLEMGDIDGDGRLEALGFDGRVESPIFPKFIEGRGELLIMAPDERSEEWTVSGRPVVSNSVSSHAMPIVDLDGDGELDLLQRGEDGDAHWYAFDTGGDRLDAEAVLDDELVPPTGVGSGFTTLIQARDLDRDGDLDLIYHRGLGSGGNWIQVLLQGSPREFSNAQQFQLGASSQVTDFELLDLDLDGALDLAATYNNGDSTSFFNQPTWHRGVGGGEFSFWNSLGSYSGRYFGGSDTADIDLDGDLDLIQMAKSSDSGVDTVGIDIYQAEVGGPGPRLHLSAGDQLTDIPYGGVSVADIDGNGLPDIVSVNMLAVPSDPTTDEPVMVFYQTSPLEFVPEVLSGVNGATLGAIEASDLDQDGHCDLVWTERDPGDSVVVAWQEASGDFTVERFSMGQATLARRMTGLELVDLDRNGHTDIVVMSQGVEPTVLSQRMRRVIEARQPFPEIPDDVDAVADGGLVADIDGDGALDVVRINRDDDLNDYGFAVHWGGNQ